MSSSATLYELADARLVLDRIIDEAEGELTPEIEAALDALGGKIDEKIERVGLYVRERLAHAEAVKIERDRLAAIVTREEKAAAGLKRYLLAQMTRIGKRKVVGLLATVSVAKNSQPSMRVSVDPEKLWTPGNALVLRAEKVEYSVNRAAVLDAWKADAGSLPPEITVEQGEHVRIT